MSEPETGLPARAPASPPGDRRPRSGLAQVGSDRFSFTETVGGVRGLVEAVLPSVVFVVAYAVTTDLRSSVLAAVAVAAVATVSRLVRRERLTQALSGLVGVLIAAWFASRSGQAEDFYLPGLYVNIVYTIVYAGSILLRWPVLGLLLGPLLGEGLAWRHDKARLSAYQKVTALWVGLFVLRLAVQGPLYLAGMVAALGTARVVMGLPLFGLVAYLSWLLLRSVPQARPAGSESARQPLRG